MRFLRQRLILRRKAFHGIEDDNVSRRQTVVRPRFIMALRKSGLQQGGKKKIASEIAGKGAACAVCALLARGKSNHRNTAKGISEGRHGRVPPVRMLGPAFLPQGDQAGAERAIKRRFCMGNGAFQRHAQRLGAVPWPIQAFFTATRLRSVRTGRCRGHGRQER